MDCGVFEFEERILFLLQTWIKIANIDLKVCSSNNTKMQIWLMLNLMIQSDRDNGVFSLFLYIHQFNVFDEIYAKRLVAIELATFNGQLCIFS